MSERYRVVDGSQSVHCCFEATVVDISRPVLLHSGKQYVDSTTGRPQFVAVCECFERDDAERIAAALNAAASAERVGA